jgi:hypothetical protein
MQMSFFNLDDPLLNQRRNLKFRYKYGNSYGGVDETQ